MKLAFVCVQNAGRSQMSAAFAEREVSAHGLDGEVSVVTGGTHPVGAVHPEVVEAMAELGVDLSGNVPREMDGTEVRDRDLPDPHGASVERVHEIREEVRERVSATFDELDAEPARTD